MNKIVITCPDSTPPSGVEFSVRATHQLEVDVEPKSGRMMPRYPVALYVKWKGQVPTNPTTFEGLNPPKQPRLRLDVMPRNFEPILIDIHFAFPTEKDSFCYTFNGTDWHSSEDIPVISSSDLVTASNSTSNPNLEGIDTTFPIKALAARESNRSQWLKRQSDRTLETLLEVQQETKRRDNSLSLQTELKSMQDLVRKRRTEIHSENSCLLQ